MLNTPTRPSFTFFNIFLGAITLVLIALSCYLAQATEIRVAWEPVARAARSVAQLFASWLLLLWLQAKWMRDAPLLSFWTERLRVAVFFCFWVTLLNNLYIVPMYACARSDVGLSDYLLAQFDRSIGLEVPDVLAFVERHPRIGIVLAVCYDLLLPLMLVAVLLPPVTGRVQPAKEYVVGCLAAACLSIPLFAVFQAEGPWVVYGYTTGEAQRRYVEVFRALHTGGAFDLVLGQHVGILTFPSFHCALALLSAVALWPIPYVRWLAAGLAVLITIATLTTGWHYIADVVAGVVLTGVSVAAARAYTVAEWRFSVAEDRSLAGSAEPEVTDQEHPVGEVLLAGD